MLSSKFKGVVKLLRLPKLSPTMDAGKLIKWHGGVGDLIPAYELIIDLEVNNLTQFDKQLKSTMQIELQEEMYIAKLLQKTGSYLHVDTNLAIMCEEKDDINVINGINNDQFDKNIEAVMWQAYIKLNGPNDFRGGCN